MVAKKNNGSSLTDEQIKEIKSYGDSIVSLKDFVEAVRTRPTMYNGFIGNKGFLRCFREIFHNAIDELMRVKSPCNRIEVTYDERTCTATVEDNGRGLPFDNIIRICTKQHTSSNYSKDASEFTAGTNGTGCKITNALSTRFTVESYILGEGRRVEFIEGYPWKYGEKVIPNKSNKQGTKITFTPSIEVLGPITIQIGDILSLIQILSPLTHIGDQIFFTGINKAGEVMNTVITNENGLLGILESICHKPMIVPIAFGGDNGTIKCNVLLSYDTEEGAGLDGIVSYSNFCPTISSESSHVKGFIAGLKKFFIGYMNKVYLNSINSNGKKTKKNNVTVIESDIRTGLRAVIDAAHVEPMFSGQSKDILDMPDVEAYVRELTIQALNEWSRNNPQILNKMCKYFKEVATLRSSVDEKRVKLQNQYSSSATTGLPSKYIAPTKRKGELFIVEGDSAKGSMENHRHNASQGVFPIRGMILNCFERDEKVCLQNAEVAGILAIMDAGYGKSFDINKLEWEKIICCFTGDTKVRLVGGESISFKDLTKMAEENPLKDIWVYSYDIDNARYIPAKATDIGVKETVDKIAVVSLDDGSIIKCTTDHKFLTRDRGYVEAESLNSYESLVPLYEETMNTIDNLVCINDDNLISTPDDWNKYYNHKVVSVEIVNLEEPIPMYCLSVPKYNNFAVAGSNDGCVIVHNCGDADPAGHFICSLLLRMFLRFTPQAIMAGRIYRSVPPLYYATVRNKKVYFTDRLELVKYTQKIFSKNNAITTMKNNKLNSKDIEIFLYNNLDYVYELDKIAGRYRVDPHILEIYLNNRNQSASSICKAIQKQYRFMEKKNINGHVVCDGIANGISNTLLINDRMLEESMDIIKIMEGNLYPYYKVNGKVMGIYDIMRLYEVSQPSNITRLKGLGEQSGEELGESVVLPGDMGNRTLLQYTMDSAMKEIEEIREYESNKNKLLTNLVVTRLDVAD